MSKTKTEVINWHNARSTRFKDNWSLEDVLWICKNYIESSKNELIEKFGSESKYKSVVYITSSLGIKKNKERLSFKTWSNEEESILKMNYENTYIDDLLKLLPSRSEDSIRRKAFRMNISQNMSLLYLHNSSIYKNINGVMFKKCKECDCLIEMNDNNFWKDNTPSGYKNTCKKCLIVDINDDTFSKIEYTEYASGIYRITNLFNGKIYIGSAVDLIDRKKAHISKLNKQNHENEYLQRSWIKYGQDNFKFEIIELVDDKSKLIEREQYWIDNTNCFERNIGYNLCPTAGSPLGLEVSFETREKLRNNNKNKREVVQCDMDGNYINEFRSLREVTRQLGYNANSIMLCCKHKYKQFKGYIWFYRDEYYQLNNC